eukprot:1383961-Amorphochlora_amoeboformis.AAC.1
MMQVQTRVFLNRIYVCGRERGRGRKKGRGRREVTCWTKKCSNFSSSLSFKDKDGVRKRLERLHDGVEVLRPNTGRVLVSTREVENLEDGGGGKGFVMPGA